MSASNGDEELNIGILIAVKNKLKKFCQKSVLDMYTTNLFVFKIKAAKEAPLFATSTLQTVLIEITIIN